MFYREIISRPNNNWPRLQSFNLFSAEKFFNAVTTKMPDHGSSLSIYVSVIFYVYTRLPRTEWIYSNIELEVLFPDVIGLDNIPYSVSIRDFMNSWPMNSDTWSYLIYVGLRYLTNHVVSTNFAIYITYLSLCCVIFIHPVTRYIMVTSLRFKFSFFTFFVWLSYLLYPHIVCSTVFPQLH